MDETADRQAPVIVTLFFGSDNQPYQIRASLQPDYASVDYDVSGPTPPARWQAEAGPIFLTQTGGCSTTGFYDGPAAALAEGFADLLLSFDIEPTFVDDTAFAYWFMRVGGHGSWHRVPAGDTVSHCGITRKPGDHIDSDAPSNAMKRLCAVCLTHANR